MTPEPEPPQAAADTRQAYAAAQSTAGAAEGAAAEAGRTTMATVRAPWATGPEWDNWGTTPVERMAQVEAEEVLLGRVPRDSDLLPETRRILSASDAWLAAGGFEAAREPEPDPELEAG